MEVLEGFMIVGGEKTQQFQTKIRRLMGKKYGLLVNSGSSANLLALKVLSLPPGSEVITPAVTFGTTISPIYMNNLIPSYVDVGIGTYQIDILKVEAAISNKTKAILVPSLMGNVPDYRELRRLADKHKLWLIEDSCDTLGVKLDGVPTGRYTDITTTSFYASHVITTGGHGGFIAFNDDEWLDKIKTYISWGRSSARNETEDISVRFDATLDGIPYDAKFIFEEVGFNFQSSDIDAAFGLGQLQKFPTHYEARRNNFAQLRKFFQKYEEYFILPEENPRAETCWLAFPLLVRDSAPFKRRDLAIYMEENGIQTRPFFTGNVTRHPAFRDKPSRRDGRGYPVADLVTRGSLVIGCHQGLKEEDLDYMKYHARNFLKRF